MGDLASRAASRVATTVDEEVQFYSGQTLTLTIHFKLTYDGGDGEVLLLGVLEEVLDVVTVDDAGLLENCGGHFGYV